MSTAARVGPTGLDAKSQTRASSVERRCVGVGTCAKAATLATTAAASMASVTVSARPRDALSGVVDASVGALMGGGAGAGGLRVQRPRQVPKTQN
jgi:hypothetical protein